MGDNFIGEIRMFAYDKVPTGWVPCNGAMLNIQQNAALYSLLGATFGGDGRTNFGIPDLRGRAPLATAVQLGIAQGEKGGAETVTLGMSNLPSHTHALLVSPSPGQNSVATNDASVFAQAAAPSTTVPAEKTYGAATTGNIVAMNTGTCAVTGSGNAHNNLQPSLGMCFCIATRGIYPTRP